MEFGFAFIFQLIRFANAIWFGFSIIENEDLAKIEV